MKKIIFLSVLAFSINVFSANYTVSFKTATTSQRAIVDSVEVDNTTKGIHVWVKAGELLQLSVLNTANDQLSVQDPRMHITQGANTGNSTVVFDLVNSGAVQVNVFGVDGRKLAGVVENLPQGTCSFELSLPKGVFVVQAKGEGFAYSEKITSVTNVNNTASIALLNSTPSNQPMKAKAAVSLVTLACSVGDHIQFEAYSLGYVCRTDHTVTAGDEFEEFDFQHAEDVEHSVYQVITIGTQKWMVTNLRTLMYRNGDSIHENSDAAAWAEAAVSDEPAYCDDQVVIDAADSDKLGHLYNWSAAVDPRGIAPVGWHVPTDAEWTILTNYISAHLGNSLTLGKAICSSHDWADGDSTGDVGRDTTLNNSSGFAAYPAGYRGTAGTFYPVANETYFWTSTAHSAIDGDELAYCRYIEHDLGNVYRQNNKVGYGMSIRCIMDAEPVK